MGRNMTKKENLLTEIWGASWETFIIGTVAFIIYKIFKHKKKSSDGEIIK